MIKIFPSQPRDLAASEITLQAYQKAQAAVTKVLQAKPGGLLGMEGDLVEYSTHQEHLQDFKSRHQHFVFVGIGGSSLGIQVLSEVFQVKNVTFIDNVDAAHFEGVLSRLQDVRSIGWIFISKSGSTIETLTAADFIQQFLQEKSEKLQSHCVVITEKKDSDLYRWAQEQKVLFFEVPLIVGGRFSVLSAVGLVPAILMDLDVTKIRSGAMQAYESGESLAALTSQILMSFHREEWVSILWSYSSRLTSFGLWWQQLWAESLAKKLTRGGQLAPRVSTPMPLVGATDQHSVLQQIMEGSRDKMVFFLRVDEAEQGQILLKTAHFKETQMLQGKTMGTLLKAEAEAIQLALSEVGVSNLTMQISHLKEDGLGYLLMYFHLLIIVLGEVLDINAFDQPGVELGKIKAKEILRKTRSS